MILMSFYTKFLQYMCASDYFNIERFDIEVIAKIKLCMFLLTVYVCLVYVVV